ncbi:hypothetical protein [Deinococcus sp. YIM 77859]|uniref:hypothetical protein n=1 Tax=Deinococcus sp. YIM 77859 TaxID=1540221 RepID=UPI000551B45A|nr:hypothetical protein [Deinococcus sp. YIM 77859]
MSGRAPRPLFPQAVTLRGAALIFEGDGRPALYLCAEDHAGQVRPYRVPEDATVTAVLPHPLPTLDKKKRVFLPAGSRVTFETPAAQTVLSLHAVRVAREVLAALEAYGEARESWQAARAP